MTEIRPREQFIAAASTGRTELQEFFEQFRSSLHDRTDVRSKQKTKSQFVLQLAEVLQELDKKQLSLAWHGISNICISSMERFVEVFTAEQQSDSANETKEDLVSLLQNVCCLCQATIFLDDLVVPDGLNVSAQLLHGVLLNLDSEHGDLARCICTLFRDWWKKGLSNKEKLCLHVLVYLLGEVNADAKNSRFISSAVSDLYQMHQCLKEFDFSDVEMRRIPTSPEDKIYHENIQELKQLLVCTAVHPILLKNNNGRKFLSNALILQKDLMTAMHKAILDYVLIKGNGNHSEAFGNIYFQAWMLADEVKKQTIEDVCIQDIMYRAVHLPRGKVSAHCPFTAFQGILRAVTCHKGSQQVAHMLSRLYDPIIWRSLKIGLLLPVHTHCCFALTPKCIQAINAMVRANAASLLFDAFPLLPPPDSVRQEFDELLQKQFKAIDDLLVDDYPKVRSIAVYQMCNILHDYWDVIPAHVIAVQAKKLYTELAFDASSPDVREAVFRGTVILLDNPCSQPLLKKLLPSVTLSLHDTSEKVRVAFCNMLLALRNTSTIAFWDVCPVENILAQLELDNQTVTRRLCKLLTGSFIPPEQPMQNWVMRCLNFFDRNANAARKFYLQVGDLLAPNELGEFILMISNFVCNNVTESLRREESADSESEKEQLDSTSKLEEDPLLIAGLMEAVCILNPCFNQKYSTVAPVEKEVEKTQKGKKKNSEMRELAKRIAVTLPRTVHVCFKKFHDERNINVLLHLCSQLQPASMPIFSKGIFPKLRSLPDDAPSSYYSQLIKCLVEWRWSQQILQLINDWVCDSFADNTTETESQETEPQPSKSRRSSRSGRGKAKAANKKKKTVQFTGVQKVARPLQALRYLQCIVSEEKLMASLLDCDPTLELLNVICTTLQKCQLDLNTRLCGNDNLFELWTNEMLVQGLKLRTEILCYFAVRTITGASESGDDEQNVLRRNSVQSLRNFVEWAQVDLLGNLKSTALIMQDQNSTLLSTTSLNVTSSGDTSAQGVLRRMSLIRQCLELVFASTESFLSMGIPLADSVLNLLSAFTETGVKTVDYVSSLTSLLVNAREQFLLEKWVKMKDQVDENLVSDGVGANDEAMLQVLDDVLLALMTYSRRNPNGFHTTFRTELRSRVRSLLQSEFELRSNATKHTHSLYCKKVASALLADMAHHIMSSGDFEACEKVADLPQFCACLLPLLCATSDECDYICRSTLPAIAADPQFLAENKKLRTCSAKAMVFLSYVLTKDSKNSNAAILWLEELKKLSDEYAETVGLVQPAELALP